MRLSVDGIRRFLSPENSYFWVTAILSIHAALLAWSAARQTPTPDEPMHLAGGIRRLTDGKFDVDLGNPPLMGNVAALPVIFAKPITNWASLPDSHMIGHEFSLLNGPRTMWLFALGRWACISFSIIGGLVIYLWSKEVFGASSALISLILWAFCPQVMAHGQLMTGDVPTSAMGVMAFYAFWRWLKQPSWGRATWCGIAFGLAESSKYVWVIIYPLWPIIWVIWRRTRKQPVAMSFWEEFAQFCFIYVLCLNVLAIAYSYEGVGKPLRDLKFMSRAVRYVLPEIALALPAPFPKPYIEGIDAVSADREKEFPSYLGGRWQFGRFPYFYLVVLLIKLPIGTIFLLELTGFLTVWRKTYRTDWQTELLLFGTGLAVISFVTIATSSQFDRYLLPSYPFLFIWAGKAAWTFREHLVLAKVAVIPALTWMVLSSLSVYPHCMVYFNELAGGPERGHEWLADSGSDWGQDLLYLKEWLADHPEVKDLKMAYFGRVDPSVFGIEYKLPPKLHPETADNPQDFANEGPHPGWFAISTSVMRGIYFEVMPRSGQPIWLDQANYRYFLDVKPYATIGHSIHIYHLDCKTANKLRVQYHFLPVKCDDDSED